jgi:hypothetical protein
MNQLVYSILLEFAFGYLFLKKVTGFLKKVTGFLKKVTGFLKKVASFLKKVSGFLKKVASFPASARLRMTEIVDRLSSAVGSLGI